MNYFEEINSDLLLYKKLFFLFVKWGVNNIIASAVSVEYYCTKRSKGRSS